MAPRNTRDPFAFTNTLFIPDELIAVEFVESSKQGAWFIVCRYRDAATFGQLRISAQQDLKTLPWRIVAEIEPLGFLNHHPSHRSWRRQPFIPGGTRAGCTHPLGSRYTRRRIAWNSSSEPKMRCLSRSNLPQRSARPSSPATAQFDGECDK